LGLAIGARAPASTTTIPSSFKWEPTRLRSAPKRNYTGR